MRNENVCYDEEEHRIYVWCTECGEEFSFPCTQDQWEKLIAKRTVIQDVFPELKPEERELFAGLCVCGACWDRLLGKEE